MTETLLGKGVKWNKQTNKQKLARSCFLFVVSLFARLFLHRKKAINNIYEYDPFMITPTLSIQESIAILFSLDHLSCDQTTFLVNYDHVHVHDVIKETESVNIGLIILINKKLISTFILTFSFIFGISKITYALVFTIISLPVILSNLHNVDNI
jgi:hypothetical protein